MCTCCGSIHCNSVVVATAASVANTSALVSLMVDLVVSLIVYIFFCVGWKMDVGPGFARCEEGAGGDVSSFACQ